MNTNIYKTFLFSCLLAGLSCLTASAQNCTVVDHPDMNFMDSNGDGIDGDTSEAIFVSSTSGNDNNSGSMSSPVATLDKAMTLAIAAGKDIYIAKGNYTLSQPLVVGDGISLYGLFSGQPSWTRQGSNQVKINGPSNVLLFQGNTLSSTIAGLEITASDATGPGASSQAVVISSCTELISLIGNKISSGMGAKGQDGSNGSAGAGGGNGGNGGNGSCDGNIPGSQGPAGGSACGQTGGIGGIGGVGSANGGTGQTIAGSTGGSGGPWGDPGSSGVKGGDGANGTTGTPGAPASNTINFSSDIYVNLNGNNGTDGTNGAGGSGGGGGGGQHCSFCDDGSGNGGGGGGGGGCKGLQGQGGQGGGASIAVAVIYSLAYLENNTIITKKGGDGGKGGNGGTGGTGGSPGYGGTNCTSEVGKGGDGGKGGNGGNGGGGSGGNGGPSIGIVAYATSSVYAILNNVTSGFGGNGGLGGNTPGGSPASSGLAGINPGSYGTISAFEPDVAGDVCIEDGDFDRPSSGSAPASVQVLLSTPSPKSITVDYSFSNGSAVENTDFDFSNGSLTFPPYTTVASIPFSILDANAATDKTFIITLSNLTGAGTIIRNSNKVTIRKSDGTGIIGQPGLPFVLNEYPNPFSSGAEIHYSLAPGSHVCITLLDASGKLVNTLFDGYTDTRDNMTEIPADQLAPGVYYYTFSLNGVTVASRKLVLVR